ncbi:hypothetical protein EV641_1281 [Rhodococcus sp. SMB37]|uniref:hypothetical protein n=1 Tax=Rhodococcus sp. SMB37 TaxID=2512213 RepID=UPI00104941F9|nr:hypothetical protein [Rhodococcus sp. SMB37]TCN42433.1 hypothetical protein EV641_1281 [Rhodococcus sp. SMB37]
MSAETTSTITPTIEDLFNEYDQWRVVLDQDSDQFDTISKMVALYRFAISHYNEPGIELLLQAIEAVEAADKDR